MNDGYVRQFYEQVVRYVRHVPMLVPGELVVVAVSGGIDSAVLLYTLSALRQRLSIQLHCAHLNHQFRGAEAERDAEFVRNFSAQLGLPCSIETRNVPEFVRQHKLSPQDAARQLRYEFLTALADRLGASKIATAHTADDQAETVLMGLIRGVGLHGLGGIQPIMNGTIIRPFLHITRQDIATFAGVAGVEFVEDSSNASRKYLRNAVRLDLLPLLKEQFNPAIVTRLGMYARRFREDAECVEQIARERYPLICTNLPQVVKINLDFFTKECITIQRALLYQGFEALTGNRHCLESGHARTVIALYTTKSPGKQASLPHGVRAYRDSAWGYMTTEREVAREPNFSEACLAAPGTTRLGQFRIMIEAADSGYDYVRDFTAKAQRHREKHRGKDSVPLRLCGKESDTMWEQDLDAGQVQFPIRIRFRHPGDVFQPFGMSGKKRVKKFFIDRKIPKNKRESIPIFEDAAGIVWIAGYSIDERVKITAQTTRVLRCCVEIAGEPISTSR